MFRDADGACVDLNFAKVSGEISFLVKWQGYRLDESTWEPEENISEALIR